VIDWHEKAATVRHELIQPVLHSPIHDKTSMSNVS
jgi:hypothetical protein